MKPERKKGDMVRKLTPHPMARLRYTVEFMRAGYKHDEAERLAIEKALSKGQYAPNTQLRLELEELIQKEKEADAKQNKPESVGD